MQEKGIGSKGPTNMIRAAEVARMLGLSRQHVYLLAARGDIPSIKLGGAVRFDPRDVEAYIEAHRRGTTTGDAA